jgi:hypothetical protein
VNTPRKIKAAFLIVCIALAVMFGSTQQSKAAYYDNYYSNYVSYINAYNSTGYSPYLYIASAYYYYYLSGYYGDYYGYYSDSFAFKSDQHINASYLSPSTSHDINYNYYAYIGDWYFHHYVLRDR